MQETKYIKKDYYNNIILALMNKTVEIPVEKIIKFCNKEIALLDKKAQKAREAAEKKKNEIDELFDAVREALSDKPQTVSEITAIVAEVEGATQSKVVYRLSKLVDLGMATRISITVKDEDGKSRQLKAYIIRED